jgi:UrcA family protein
MNTHSPRIGRPSLVGRAAAVAAIVLSVSAAAGNQTMHVSEKVSTVGVNVNTPEGARKLYVRLKAASRRVCGDTRVGLEVPQASCSDDALGNAIRSANLPQLTMVYLRWHSVQTAQQHGIRIPLLVADK